MVDPAEDERFYFIAADGTRRASTEQALRKALRVGELHAKTLVWRSGWNEWLPANRVHELSSSIPELEREHPREPKRDLQVTHPPATPALGRVTTLAPRPVGALVASATHGPARDALAPSSFGRLGPSRRPTAATAAAATRLSGTPPPPPSRGRSAMPTLGEDQAVVSPTATLRPPGAVPPPARGVPVPAFDSSPRASALMTPMPFFGPAGGELDTPSPAPPAATQLGAPALPATAALDSTLEVAQRVPPESGRTASDATATAHRAQPSALEEEVRHPPSRDSVLRVGRIGLDSRSVVMGLSALSGALLAALVGVWLAHSRKAPAPDTDASPSASVPVAIAPALPVPPGCKLLLPAARLAANIERTVPPYASKIANEGALALGIAASKTKGIGLRVDPATLDVLPVFEEEGKDAVRGVVPLARSGARAFFVDRDDRVLRSAHTVDEIPPFTLGVSEAGFARVVAGSASVVWPLPADTKITEPRSAPLGTFGYGVTFRRGGQSGVVLVGLVASDGSKKSELAEIPGAPKFLGTPMIGGSASGALVAFAGRDSAEAGWKLYVSRIEPGQAPGPARALIEGDAGSVISPSLAELSAGRWLVQWTEGASGQYHVHVQSFAKDLSPIGQSVLVSPKGANAGQGALATFPGGAVTLFILTTAGHDELWGATLSCP